LRQEEGSSLLLALIMLATFTISTAGLVQFSRAQEWGSGHERQATQSFAIAESGLHYAIASIQYRDAYDGVPVSSTIPSTTVSVAGGAATYSATKTALGLWTVYSTGVSPNGQVTRQVEEQVRLKGYIAPAWMYGFSTFATSGCITTTGSAKITVPVYIAGDYCATGNSGIAEPAGKSGTIDVYIGGQFKPTGGASIGTKSGSVVTPVRSVVVVGGCPNATGNNCAASNSSIYTNSLAGSGTPVTKPTVDASAIYALGNWSAPTCSTGSFVFDVNNFRNSSIPSVDFPGSTSFDCTVRDSSGVKTIGTLAWNNTTKSLTINGLVFIDTANFSVSAKTFSYAGSGTLYVNGAIGFSLSAMCGPPATVVSGACSGTWDPSQGTLTFVALNSGSASPAMDFTGGSQVDASAYANGEVNMSGGSQIRGPVIADTATLTGGSSAVSPYGQPVSSPGVAGGYEPVRGSWRQIR